MSQTYISQIVVVLALLLPRILPGLSIGNDELTSLVQAAVVAGGILWTLYRRYQVGDITPVGLRKG